MAGAGWRTTRSLSRSRLSKRRLPRPRSMVAIYLNKEAATEFGPVSSHTPSVWDRTLRLAFVNTHTLRRTHSNSLSGTMREVKRHSFRKRTSIIDANRNAATRLRIAYAQARAEGKRPVSGRQPCWIKSFTRCSALAGMLVSVPRRHRLTREYRRGEDDEDECN